MFSGGAHGWNIDIDADVRVCQQVRLLREIGTVAGWRVCICTLLGPEGPDPHLRMRGRTSGPLLLDIHSQGEGYRPYFENYTVDASILDS